MALKSLLVDTNIFLEILLQQERSLLCKRFLTNNIDSICISDFSLHSIGVVTFRQNQAGLFTQFTQDILPCVSVLTLPIADYAQLDAVQQSCRLDFDDAYQYSLAKSYSLKLVTLDKDFNRLNRNEVEIMFLQ